MNPATANTGGTAPGAESTSVPRVWTVAAYRAGEQGQTLALAAALGWPFEIKTLSYRWPAIRTNVLRGSDLGGIDVDGSSPLVSPWPDLVISAGMRNEPVCRWIRQQSGGRTRIVHIGRPWARLEKFDLIITTPQYRLPERPNVLQNTLTLHRITRQRLATEGAVWQPCLGDLPAPYVAVVVGGNSGPWTFGPRAAARLGAQASEMANAQGGSLLVTTSARTAPAAIRALEAAIDAPRQFYHWQPDDGDNPYYGYLALADELIVTADSISMLSEACATGKPVYMFDAGLGDSVWQYFFGPAASGLDFRLKALQYRWAMRWAPQRATRDLTRVHKRLIDSGHAVWLGDPWPGEPPPARTDMEQPVARVRALLDRQDPSAGVTEIPRAGTSARSAPR